MKSPSLLLGVFHLPFSCIGFISIAHKTFGYGYVSDLSSEVLWQNHVQRYVDRLEKNCRRYRSPYVRIRHQRMNETLKSEDRSLEWLHEGSGRRLTDGVEVIWSKSILLSAWIG